MIRATPRVANVSARSPDHGLWHFNHGPPEKLPEGHFFRVTAANSHGCGLESFHGKSSTTFPVRFHEESRMCAGLALPPCGSRFFPLHHIGIAVAYSRVRSRPKRKQKGAEHPCGKLDEWKTETELF